VTESQGPTAPSTRSFRRILGLVVLAGIAVVAIVADRCSNLPAARTSRELVREIYGASKDVVVEPMKALAKKALREGLVVFIESVELPDAGASARLVAHVRNGTFERTTVPFLFYLRDIYGNIAEAESGEHRDLAYAGPAPASDGENGGGDGEPEGEAGAGIGVLSPANLAYARTLLRVYDALFLQLKPGAAATGPLRDRYEPAAYASMKEVIRETFTAFVKPNTSDDATENPTTEYEHALREFLADEQRLADLAEFLTDLVREQSLDWLESWQAAERRRKLRSAWVEGMIDDNRYYEVADWAAARERRRLVVHVVVDGLQGLLLEGLARLSMGDREHAASLYVRDLVERYRDPRFDPATWGASGNLPAPLGAAIQTLADDAPVRPEYLSNFKRHFFADGAPSVVAHVGSVDTPSISVRNLPVAFSGHAVAGPQGTGIPNFSYLDRSTDRGWYFWGSDVVHLERIFGNREDEIPNGIHREGDAGARTLHERMPARSTMSVAAVIDSGATEKLFGHFAIPAGEISRDIVERTALTRLRQRAALEEQLASNRAFLVANRDLERTFFGALFSNVNALTRFHESARFLAEHEDEGLPDYLLFYDAWPDHFAHYTGPFDDAILGWKGEYDRLDFFVGKLLDVYAQVPAAGGERGETLLDRALVGVTSDHGLTYTPRLISTDEILFDALRTEGHDVRYQKLTHDEGGLPAIHGEGNLKATRGFDAVVGSTAGGSYIIDLFDPDEKQRGRHPGYHDLTALPLRSGADLDWIDAVKRLVKDDLDIAVVRERGPKKGERWPDDVDAAVRVIAPGERGEARITRLRSGRIRYERLGDGDPLGLVDAVRPFLIAPGGPTVDEVKSAIAAAIGDPAGRSEEEWIELLAPTLRCDAVPQLIRLYDSERAGTLNLFPALHVGMNSSVSGRHAGEAFEEKNGAILFRAAGLGPAGRIQTARTGSVPVTLYEWIDGSDMSGFGYPSLLAHEAMAVLERPGGTGASSATASASNARKDLR
jgi:hypothetical protein